MTNSYYISDSRRLGIVDGKAESQYVTEPNFSAFTKDAFAAGRRKSQKKPAV